MRNAIVLIGNFNLRFFFFRHYGVKIDKSRAAAKEKLIFQISSIYQLLPDEVSEEDKLQLRSFQIKLDELYCEKA